MLSTGGAWAQKYPERAVTRKGTKLYDKGDFTGAETQYRRALELDPALREAGFNLGNALWRQEKAEDAARAWETIAKDSLAPAPLVSAASYNLGNMALGGQQLDAAIEAYKQSLRLNPNDTEAKFNLAYAQAMKQQQEDQKQDQDQNQDQKQDQDQDQNDPQNSESDRQEGEGQNDPQQGQNDPPPPAQQQNGQSRIDPRAAEQMLDAMQAAEDDTREKVNAREVQAGARSGKNW
jgi:tetratricopeptide (TPR) repeat protein